MKRLLSFITILLVSCTSNNDNDCQPMVFFIEQIELQLVDSNTGEDLLNSGAIPLNQLSVVDLDSGQEFPASTSFSVDNDITYLTLYLPLTNGPLSYQINVNNQYLFKVSFVKNRVSVDDCDSIESIDEFEIDNYPFEYNMGYYKVLL